VNPIVVAPAMDVDVTVNVDVVDVSIDASNVSVNAARGGTPVNAARGGTPVNVAAGDIAVDVASVDVGVTHPPRSVSNLWPCTRAASRDGSPSGTRPYATEKQYDEDYNDVSHRLASFEISLHFNLRHSGFDDACLTG